MKDKINLNSEYYYRQDGKTYIQVSERKFDSCQGCAFYKKGCQHAKAHNLIGCGDNHSIFMEVLVSAYTDHFLKEGTNE